MFQHWVTYLLLASKVEEEAAYYSKMTGYFYIMSKCDILLNAF